MGSKIQEGDWFGLAQWILGQDQTSRGESELGAGEELSVEDEVDLLNEMDAEDAEADRAKPHEVQMEDTFVRRESEPKRYMSRLDAMEMGGWDPVDGWPRTASDFPKRGGGQ